MLVAHKGYNAKKLESTCYALSLLDTYETESYFSLRLKLFKNLHNFLTAKPNLTLLVTQRFPHSSSHKKQTV